MQIQAENSPSEQVLATIRAGMRRYTESCVPWEEYTDLAFVARDDDGSVIGAVLGKTGRGWLCVEVLWVNESARQKGVGTKLMQQAETEARQRGCFGAYLNTFSYQARPFYEKMGYSVFGTLQDFPKGHQRFYMSKKL